jgi:hypothetical protein
MDGGKRTASLLKQAVEEELQSSVPSTAHLVQVIVRVYANVKGLAKTYKEMEILPESASLDEFVRGFNMGDAMCDYVDAGNGKECSDEKVKGRPPTVGQCSVSADFAKRLSNMIWRTSTVSGFSLVARPTTGTPVCSARSSRMRQSVGGSSFSKGPPLPTNWPTSRTDSVQSRSTMFSGARS